MEKYLNIENLWGMVPDSIWFALRSYLRNLDTDNFYDLNGITEVDILELRKIGKCKAEEVKQILNEYGINVEKEPNTLSHIIKKRLSTRAWNILDRIPGSYTNNIYDLNGKDISFIANRRNAGERTVKEIVKVLGEYGIYFN